MHFTAKSGVIFTLLRKEPYVRRDGEPSEIWHWQAACAMEGCSSFFEITTGPTHDADRFGRKHCDAHKATRAECTARAALRNRKLTDAEVLEIQKLASEGLRPEDLTLIFPVSARTLYDVIKGKKYKVSKS